MAYDDFPAAMAPMGELNKDGLTEDLLGASAFLVAAGYPASADRGRGLLHGRHRRLLRLDPRHRGCRGELLRRWRRDRPLRSGAPDRTGEPPPERLDGLYGDLDKGIPVEQVEVLRAAAAATSHPTEVLRYADAEHGFNCDGRPAVYNEEASADATRRRWSSSTRHWRRR